MSTLSQFAGGGVKSVQRGTATAGNVTISAVNTAKSVVIATVSNGAVRYGDSVGGLAYYGASARAALTNATTVTITNGVATGSAAIFLGNPSVDWQVVEYY